MEPGKTYRLRIIGATSLVYLALSIQGHCMHVIEVDGTNIEPLKVDYLEVNAGQRYSVLITANQQQGDYWIQTKILWRESKINNGMSLLKVSGFASRIKPHYRFPAPLSLPQEAPEWVTSQFVPLNKSRFPSGTATLNLTLVGKQANITKDNNTYIKWTINDIAHELPTDKPLLQHAYDGTDVNLPSESQMITIKYGDIVDIILQNTAALNGICEEHPWHLHGHKFFELGSGPGTYDPNTAKLNTVNPLERDTTTLFPYTGAYFQPKLAAHEPCGWKVIRFKADNPGVWPLHCHITSHMLIGMCVVFNEAIDYAPRPNFRLNEQFL